MTDFLDNESDDYTEFNSGPYCKHWNDPIECTITCNACGHDCRNHPLECDVCECTDWIEY